MKAKELREMTNEELNAKLKSLKQELFNLRFSHATGQLTNPMQLNKCKKAGTKYYLDGLKDITFSKKGFCETAAEHPELLNRLYDLSLPILQKQLSVDTGFGDSESDDDKMDSYMSVMSMLNDD